MQGKPGFYSVVSRLPGYPRSGGIFEEEEIRLALTVLTNGGSSRSPILLEKPQFDLVHERPETKAWHGGGCRNAAAH